MKVLVTGASGFIGRYLVKNLAHDGIDYITIGRNAKDNNENIRFDLLSSEDLLSTLRKIKPTHLIHLAWYAEHGRYWKSPLNIDWLMATARLIEAFCQSGGKHAVVAGTCAEYDWRYGFFNEDLTPLNPATLYGTAKNATHSLSRNICSEYGAGLSWARIFFPYGAGGSRESLIPTLCDVFSSAKPAVSVNKHVYRDLLHVSDVADAINLCSKSEAEGAINICSGQPLRLESIVRTVASLCNQSPDRVLSMKSNRVGEPALLVGDNQKLKKLGWKQKVSFENGVQDYLKTGKV